jgi:hypothetical protein
MKDLAEAPFRKLVRPIQDLGLALAMKGRWAEAWRER